MVMVMVMARSKGTFGHCAWMRGGIRRVSGISQVFPSWDWGVRKGCAASPRGEAGRAGGWAGEGMGAVHWHGCAKPHKRGVRCDSIEGGKEFPPFDREWELGIGNWESGSWNWGSRRGRESQLPTPNSQCCYIYTLLTGTFCPPPTAATRIPPRFVQFPCPILWTNYRVKKG